MYMQSLSYTLLFVFAIGPYIGHAAATDTGSSGSPILREYDHDWIVVGLHCGALQKEINVATRITVIVDDILGKPYTGESE